MRAADPDADIDIQVSHDYPIQVTVSGPGGQLLWKNRQQNLFRKNGTKRKQSIKEIGEAVQRYQSA